MNKESAKLPRDPNQLAAWTVAVLRADTKAGTQDAQGNSRCIPANISAQMAAIGPQRAARFARSGHLMLGKL